MLCGNGNQVDRFNATQIDQPIPRERVSSLSDQPGRACRALPPALAGGGGVAVGLSGVRPGKANGQTANDIIRRQKLRVTAYNLLTRLRKGAIIDNDNQNREE